MATMTMLSQDVIVNAFGRLANQQYVLSEQEIKQQEAAKRATESRRARKEKQKQHAEAVERLKEQAETQRLEQEKEAQRKAEIEEKEAQEREAELAEQARVDELQRKRIEDEAATARAAAELALMLQEQEENQKKEENMKHAQEEQERHQEELAVLREKLQEEQEKAAEKERIMLAKFEEQKQQMQTILALMEQKFQEAQQAENERKKIEEADRFAKANGGGFFSDADFTKQDSPKKPTIAPDELKELSKNCNLIKQNAMRQAFVWLTLGAGVVETTNEVLGEPFLKAEGFSDRVITALEEGKFSQGLEALALQPGAMKVLGDPYNSLGGTFLSELMKTHLDNKKKIEKMGLRRNNATTTAAPRPKHESGEDAKHATPVAAASTTPHQTTGPCSCQNCMTTMFTAFCKNMQQQQQQQPQPQPDIVAQQQQQQIMQMMEAQQRLADAQRLEQMRELKAQREREQSELETLKKQLLEEHQRAKALNELLEQKSQQKPLVESVQQVSPHLEEVPFEMRRVQNVEYENRRRSESLERSRRRENLSTSYRNRSRSRYHGSASENSGSEDEKKQLQPILKPTIYSKQQEPLCEEHKHVSWQQTYGGVIMPGQEKTVQETITPIIDKKTGGTRPSFTMTPRTRASLVGKETLDNFQSGISAWGPVLDQLPNLMECMQGGAANEQTKTPVIAF